MNDMFTRSVKKQIPSSQKVFVMKYLVCLFLMLAPSVFGVNKPTKKFYFKENKNVGLSLKASSGDDVVILFHDTKSNKVTVSSWMKFTSKEGRGHATVSLGKLTTSRYQYEFPALPKNIPADLKAEYEKEMQKINDDFKRAEFLMGVKVVGGDGYVIRGGYRNIVGLDTLKSEPKESVGNIEVASSMGCLSLEATLVKESIKMYVLQGASKSIKEFFQKKKWEYEPTPTTLTIMSN